MHIPRHLVSLAAVLAVTCALGCSKKPNQPSPPPKAVELGKIELTPDQPANFTLSPHKSCLLTGHQTPDGIQIKVEITATNKDGVITHSQGNIEVSPGRSCAIAMGSEAVSFTPTLKNQ